MATSARTILTGDVHGCLDELEKLRRTLSISGDDRAILVGDLVAKGPDSAGVIAWARAHRAESVLGNHDEVLLRYDEARREDRRAADAPEAVRKTARKLGDEDWAGLQSLPLLIAIPEHRALAVHAGLVPGVPLAAQPGTRKPPLPTVSHAHPKVHVLHVRAPVPRELPSVAPEPVPLVVPVETPTDPELTEDVHHLLLETALDHAQDLDRAERLRALANALEPRIRALPPEAPERAWLTWARTTLSPRRSATSPRPSSPPASPVDPRSARSSKAPRPRRPRSREHRQLESNDVIKLTTEHIPSPQEPEHGSRRRLREVRVGHLQ